MPLLDACRKAGLVLLTVTLIGTAGAEDIKEGAEETKEKEPQYESGSILIPAASEQEPKRQEFSAHLADRYLTNGALAWSRSEGCISCHTNGSYLTVRGALTSRLGPPPVEVRSFFVEQVRKLTGTSGLKSDVTGTSTAYIALGLAEWDVHVTKSLSPETDQALRLMFSAQLENGSWFNQTCWPPLESSEFQVTTVAALAVATAPGWLAELDDDGLQEQVDKLKEYLQQTDPLNDYGRISLLWAATRIPALLTDVQKQAFIDMTWSHQRADGGWSIRTFAKPEDWGEGNRAERLRAEPEFDNPPSDGHMTGLAVLILRDAGMAVVDPRIQAAVNWLKTNQRESGRWWTRSLNNDSYHFITFSSTGYALLALAKCDAL